MSSLNFNDSIVLRALFLRVRHLPALFHYKTPFFVALCITVVSTMFLIDSRSLLAADSMWADESGYHSQAATYYVSKTGNNQDGTSWSTAWNELDQIDWTRIEPGDTLLIDGGSIEMTYSTSMQIASSGTSDAPIRIQAATEAGRDGKIVLFGGRVNALPYCFQDSYNYQTDGIVRFGIRTNDHSWLVIDGLDWRGITIHGYRESGIRIDRYSQNVTIRNVEIYNNGYAEYRADGWFPEGVGIRLAGPNMLVERAIIHDNGQDAIQSMWDDNNISNFRLNESWLYNGRPHLTVDEESWNYCTHTDGIQLFDGGFISGVTVENSVVGPGFTNGLIMGQTWTSNGNKVDVHDVLLRNSLFTKAADNGIFGYEGSDSQNWTFDHVTLHCPKTKWHCITLDKQNHSVTNSIIVGSRLTFEDGLNTYSNNCIWQTSGLELGDNANPQFADVSDSDNFSLDNYTVLARSACEGRGSSITSVAQLLGTTDVALEPSPAAPPSSSEPVQPNPPSTTPPSTTFPPVEPGPQPEPPNDGSPPSENPPSDAPPSENPPSENPPSESPPSANPPSQQPGAILPANDIYAAAGQISGPFELENGVLYQPREMADVAQSGLAIYRFWITKTGFYEIEALVRAESAATDSFFINVGSDPKTDYMIWDIPNTVGFEKRVVSWRGNGTFEQSEFVPKQFFLYAGENQLYVRGREAEAYVSHFSVQPTASSVSQPIIRPIEERVPDLFMPMIVVP